MIDVQVIGKYPQADFVQGRVKALEAVGRLATEAEQAAAPVQRSHPGGHRPGTGRDAIKVRHLGKGTAVKIGIIGKSPGFFLRFVEDGHQVVKINSYERKRHKDGSYFAPNYSKQTRRGTIRGWKKVRTVIGHAAPHPFFYPTMARIAPALGDVVITTLENSVSFEEVRL